MLSVNFDKASMQAATLAQTAKGMRTLSDQLGEIIAELRIIWLGETADAYRRELEGLSGKLKLDATRCGADAEAFCARITDLQRIEDEALNILNSGSSASFPLPVASLPEPIGDES